MRRASDVRGPKSGGISSKFRVSSYEKNQRIRESKNQGQVSSKSRQRQRRKSTAPGSDVVFGVVLRGVAEFFPGVREVPVGACVA